MNTQLAKQTESTTQALAGKALAQSLHHSRPWTAFQRIAAIAVLLLAAWALMTGTSHVAVIAGSAIALYAIGFATLNVLRRSSVERRKSHVPRGTAFSDN